VNGNALTGQAAERPPELTPDQCMWDPGILLLGVHMLVNGRTLIDLGACVWASRLPSELGGRRGMVARPFAPLTAAIGLTAIGHGSGHKGSYSYPLMRSARWKSAKALLS